MRMTARYTDIDYGTNDRHDDDDDVVVCVHGPMCIWCTGIPRRGSGPGVEPEADA